MDKVREILRIKQEIVSAHEEMPGLEARQAELQEILRKQLNTKHALEQEVVDLERDTEDRRQLVENATSLVSFLKDARIQKTPHLLVCDGVQVQLISLERPIRDRIWSTSTSTPGLQQLIREADAAREYFVLILKPSGADLGLEIYERLRDAGFQAGYDTLEEGAVVMKPGGAS